MKRFSQVLFGGACVSFGIWLASLFLLWPVFIFASSIGKSSGSAPSKDTYANVAAISCSPGQIGLTTDSIYTGVCLTQAVWNWLWNSVNVTPPPAAGWTWTNQGGSSVATVGGAQVLTMPGSAGQWRNYMRPVPATPYTAYIRLSEQDLQNTAAAYVLDGVGVCFGDGSGKFEPIYVIHQSSANAFGILVEKWTAVNTFSASAGGANAAGDSSIGRLAYNSRIDFRLVDNGTTTTYSYAADGRTWVPFLSESRTAFFAAGPTTIGVCSRMNASASGSIVTIGDVTFQ